MPKQNRTLCINWDIWTDHSVMTTFDC